MVQTLISKRPAYQEDELLPLLLSRWKRVALITFLGACVGLAISLIAPKKYESSATVYVHSSNLGNASAAADMLGISMGGGSSSEYLLSVLDSRPLKTLVKAHLRPDDAARLELDEKPLPVKVTNDSRKGSLVLVCRTYSPELSATIINLMLDNLGKVVVSSSRRKSDYFAKRLDETQVELDKAGEALRRFEETHNIAMLTDDTRSAIDKLSNLEADLMKQNASIKSIDSELVNSADPEALVALKVRRRSEQSSRDYLAAQTDKLRKQISAMPAVAQQYAIRERRIAVLQKTFEMLSERYETSALSPVGEDGDYEVIERAEPVMRPASPKKSWSAIAGGVMAFLLTCCVLYVRGGKRPIVSSDYEP